MQIRGKPFVKGDPRSGRKPGQLGRKTIEIRALAQEIIHDPAGIAKMKAKYARGTLHPTIVQMLFQYGHGKPKDTIKLEGGLEELRVVIARDGELTPAPTAFLPPRLLPDADEE